CATGDGVFAVVEDEQHARGRDASGQGLRRRATGLLAYIELAGDHVRDVGVAGCGAHVHEADAVRMVVHDSGGRFHRESRLAASTRTDQRHQTGTPDELAYARDVGLASDE